VSVGGPVVTLRQTPTRERSTSLRPSWMPLGLRSHLACIDRCCDKP
jgi:hypothetical protein